MFKFSSVFTLIWIFIDVIDDFDKLDYILLILHVINYFNTNVSYAIY